MTNQPSNLEAQLEALRQEAQQAIAAADTWNAEELRVVYLGKKGHLSALLRSMGHSMPASGPELGRSPQSKKPCKQI